MNRERALKIVMVLVGLLFLALIYPLTMFFSSEAALAMMLSLYVTLGISCYWQRVTHRRIAA
jgi:hypothetical protein